jgi:hypothetical protein
MSLIEQTLWASVLVYVDWFLKEKRRRNVSAESLFYSVRFTNPKREALKRISRYFKDFYAFLLFTKCFYHDELS